MIRKAEESDLDEIIFIYDKARAFMRANGNHLQWRNGYPSRSLLEYDISSGRLYVLYDDSGIYGAFMMNVGDDPTYAVIRDGEWGDLTEYAVIHRIASSGRKNGVLDEALSFVTSICHHVRIDTHADNIPMQRALLKAHFIRRGIIVCDDGTDRIAFEQSDS